MFIQPLYDVELAEEFLTSNDKRILELYTEIKYTYIKMNMFSSGPTQVFPHVLSNTAYYQNLELSSVW